MSIRLYVLEPEATGCKLLCIQNDLWPAISGILSDNLWQFDEATQERVKEVLTAMDCCETFEECGLVTNEDLNEALAAILELIGAQKELVEIPFLPEEQQPEEWPPVPTEWQQYCDTSQAIFDAIMRLYENVYQGEIFDDALAFANIFTSLLYGTIAALLALFAEILGSGAYTLLGAIAEAQRSRVVCASIAILEADGTLDDVRDYQLEEFANWTPIPLSLLKNKVLPLAEYMFVPDRVCQCEEEECVILLGTQEPEAGCEDWILSTYSEYHEAHAVSVCFGSERYFSVAHEGWTDTGYTDMHWCQAVVECPEEWSQEFEVNLTQSYPNLPESPFEQSDTSYFLFLSATAFSVKVTFTD
jgi:hypothetical protein